MTMSNSPTTLVTATCSPRTTVTTGSGFTSTVRITGVLEGPGITHCTRHAQPTLRGTILSDEGTIGSTVGLAGVFDVTGTIPLTSLVTTAVTRTFTVTAAVTTVRTVVIGSQVTVSLDRLRTITAVVSVTVPGVSSDVAFTSTIGTST